MDRVVFVMVVIMAVVVMVVIVAVVVMIVIVMMVVMVVNHLFEFAKTTNQK